MTDAARRAQKIFKEFIDKDFSFGTYMSKIDEMMEKRQCRLIIDINDLREFDPDLAKKFQLSPFEYFPAFEAALEEIVQQKEENYDPCFIGVTGNFGKYHVTPRQLHSHFIGNLVCVEGIVTKCSISLPKFLSTIHYCPATNKFLKREYRDMTSSNGVPTGFSIPTRDNQNNPLETEYGHCTFKDTQTLFIQEMPERAPPGQLPRSVECILENDLVSTVKPGDRVRMYGVYRALSGKQRGVSSGIMRTVLIVNNIIRLGDQILRPNISGEDVEAIKNLSKQKNVVDILVKSIAPSIYGNEVVKKALLLQLFGGIEQNFDNGTHIRGDINILMVGDPSTAKSQLLRFMLTIAPLAISTTGRSSTGVGLTAAVTVDKQSKERTLQAGAMVLADRGIVCVDEFDKMSDIDRVAMHEVMEQQTVTIAKAGVHTTLNARVSVVAAANPVYGQYNREISVQRNINLPDSLLSRFDLVFIMLDNRDPTIDRNVAEHVLKMHQFRSKFDTEGEQITRNLFDDIMNETDSNKEEEFNFAEDVKIYPISFLRKYIYYAKNRYKPKLTEESSALIKEKYIELRRTNEQKTLPITARTLETIIRLSCAHAKCRLSNLVEEEDVEAVIEIMKYAILDLANKTTGKRHFESINETKRKRREDRKRKRLQEEEAMKTMDEDLMEEEPIETTETTLEDEKKLIFEILLKFMREERKQKVSFTELHEEVNKQSNRQFTLEEISTLIKKIGEGNDKIFVSDDTIYAV